MNDFVRPWAIAGGWSIDLFIGDTTRTHDDIEIAVFRKDQSKLQEYLNGWSFRKVANGNVEQWKKGEILEPPIHETYAERSNEKLEMLLNESDGQCWLYRRDLRIRRPVDQIIMRSDKGIPFLSPEIALLYKSKDPRPKDEMDFKNTYPLLNREQKKWLQEGLSLLYAEHRWIE